MCGAEVEYTPSSATSRKARDWFGIIGLKIHWCNMAKWTDVKQTTLERTLSDNVSGYLEVVKCPRDYYVAGIDTKSQESRGSERDDIGVNGLKLFCNCFAEDLMDPMIIV